MAKDMFELLINDVNSDNKIRQPNYQIRNLPFYSVYICKQNFDFPENEI